MPSTEHTRTIILSSNLSARRVARESQPRPWLRNSQLPWSIYIHGSNTSVELSPPPQFFNIPFRDQHYFQEFLLKTLEECCYDYARNNLWEELQSAVWRGSNLYSLPEWLQLRSTWFETGVTELTDWTLLFRRITLPGVRDAFFFARVFLDADMLRHKTIHREQLSTETVQSAMKLPGLLKDEQRARAVEEMNGRWINKDTRKEAMKVLLAPRKVNSSHQLLSRVQSLMEESFFNYDQRVDPQRRGRNGNEVFEQTELQRWQSAYQRSWKAPWRAPHTKFYSNANLFGVALDHMREMRNIAAHRNAVNKWDVMKYLKHSMMLAILMDDRFQAVKIEVAGEQWLASSSRRDVLIRLQTVFLETHDVDAETVKRMPEDALMEEAQEGAPDEAEGEEIQGEAVEVDGSGSEDTAEVTLIDEAAEIKKQTMTRERKRRYAIAKVFMSTELNNAKPRSRCLPVRSAFESLLFYLPIPEDDEGLVNEDGSIVEHEAVSKEAQLEGDALSYRHLGGEPEKIDDGGWSSQETPADSWLNDWSATVENAPVNQDEGEGHAEGECAEGDSIEEGEHTVEEQPEEAQLRGETIEAAEPEPEFEQENLEEAQPESESEANNLDQDEIVSAEEAPTVGPPTFGEYQAAYEQILSKSMHDIYKMTDDDLREQGWDRYT